MIQSFKVQSFLLSVIVFSYFFRAGETLTTTASNAEEKKKDPGFGNESFRATFPPDDFSTKSNFLDSRLLAMGENGLLWGETNITDYDDKLEAIGRDENSVDRDSVNYFQDSPDIEPSAHFEFKRERPSNDTDSTSVTLASTPSSKLDLTVTTERCAFGDRKCNRETERATAVTSPEIRASKVSSTDTSSTLVLWDMVRTMIPRQNVTKPDVTTETLSEDELESVTETLLDGATADQTLANIVDNGDGIDKDESVIQSQSNKSEKTKPEKENIDLDDHFGSTSLKFFLTTPMYKFTPILPDIGLSFSTFATTQVYPRASPLSSEIEFLTSHNFFQNILSPKSSEILNTMLPFTEKDAIRNVLDNISKELEHSRSPQSNPTPTETWFSGKNNFINENKIKIVGPEKVPNVILTSSFEEPTTYTPFHVKSSANDEKTIKTSVTSVISSTITLTSALTSQLSSVAVTEAPTTPMTEGTTEKTNTTPKDTTTPATPKDTTPATPKDTTTPATPKDTTTPATPKDTTTPDSSVKDVASPPRLSNPPCSSLPVCIGITLQGTTWEDFCSQQSEFKEFLSKSVSHYTKPIHSHQVILDTDVCSSGGKSVSPAHPDLSLSVYVTNDFGEYEERLTEICGIVLRKWAPPAFRESVLQVRLYDSEIQSTPLPLLPDINSGFVAAVSISAIAGVALCMLCILLVIMKQKMDQGRAPPTSTADAYSLDSLSINASIRRRRTRRSARSYLNHAFSDQEIPSHPLNQKSLCNCLKSRDLLEEEFKKIPMNMPKLDSIPEGAHVKNRYSNILPNVESRVVLQDPSGDPLKCYINANYIKGYDGKAAFYIGCQAPLPDGIEDFWKMVWEQQCRVIVMLTMFEENGTSRCAVYFPQSTLVSQQPYGDFQVSLVKKDVYEFYTMSTLRILDLEKNLFRDVIHLWFTGWPDVGVPKDPSSLITFIQQCRPYIACNAGPTIVHCSTGTGRTGVFLSLDVCMREYDESRSIDILQCVSRLRRDRAGAVQNKDQYILIHEAMLDYISQAGNHLPASTSNHKAT